MIKQKIRKETSRKIHRRIRVKFSGTAERPRLAVHRSNKHIYAQLINDVTGQTLASAGTVEATSKELCSNGGGVEAAKVIGKLIAERAKSIGVDNVIFDRGGFLYHGRIAALAEAAREGGLVF